MIRTEGLRKTYSSRRGDVDAVRGIDLGVADGEIYGLLGPNGAGKTTTMRMLATLLPPSGGRATVAGVDLLADPGKVRTRIGYVRQGNMSDPRRTGRRELYPQGRFTGLNRSDAARRAAEVIPALQLEEVADRATKTYSGGQRRRLDVALGLVHSPRLLLLDEPTTGLDPQSRAHMWGEISRLRDSGTTILVTTHYLDEADALCDRLAIVDHGLVVAQGTPPELKREIAGEAIVIGAADTEATAARLKELPGLRELQRGESEVRAYVDDAAVTLPDALRILDGAGLTVQSASVSKPSLDDVFLRKTGRSLREAS